MLLTILCMKHLISPNLAGTDVTFPSFCHAGHVICCLVCMRMLVCATGSIDVYVLLLLTLIVIQRLISHGVAGLEFIQSLPRHIIFKTALVLLSFSISPSHTRAISTGSILPNLI